MAFDANLSANPSLTASAGFKAGGSLGNSGIGGAADGAREQGAQENLLPPLHVFRFHIRFKREGSDVPMCSGAFAECSGLEATMEPKVIKPGGSNYGAVQRAGPVSFATVVLKRGMTTTRHLWHWFQLVSGGGYAYRLSAEVDMQDAAGRTVLTWGLENCLPVKFKAADLSAKGSDIGIEELHLAHEGLHLLSGRPPDLVGRPAARATLSVVRDGCPEKVIEVDFNPESLSYTLSNEMAARDNNDTGTQYISRSQATLTMDLLLDTTDTGIDVRTKTERIQALMNPGIAADRPLFSSLVSSSDSTSSSAGNIPPRVQLAWGAYSFAGIVTSFSETLDFFSSDGVPLRAAVKLRLIDDDAKLQSRRNKCSSLVDPGDQQAAQVANLGGASAVANALGDPRAARAIASLNASASLRFDAGASLSVGGGATLSAPAAFASASLDAGVTIDAGAGLSAGLEANASLGAELSGSASPNIASTAGAAFTGLRVGTTGCVSGSAGLAADRLFPSAGATASASAGFGLGGVAKAEARASLASDVGVTADLSARMTFGD